MKTLAVGIPGPDPLRLPQDTSGLKLAESSAAVRIFAAASLKVGDAGG